MRTIVYGGWYIDKQIAKCNVRGGLELSKKPNIVQDKGNWLEHEDEGQLQNTV